MSLNKGKKDTSPSKQPPEKDTLKTSITISSFQKEPGQTGIHPPHSLNAIRKPKPEDRKDGQPFIGGITEPKVSEQTYDCYNPLPKKSKESGKKKE